MCETSLIFYLATHCSTSCADRSSYANRFVVSVSLPSNLRSLIEKTEHITLHRTTFPSLTKKDYALNLVMNQFFRTKYSNPTFLSTSYGESGLIDLTLH